MADPLSQNLMPGERILWRQGRRSDRTPAIWATALLGALTGAAMDPRQGTLTVMLLVILILLSGRTLALCRARGYATAAITNERFLLALQFLGEDFEEGCQVRSIALRWIKHIEVLPGALRLKLADGRTQVLQPLGDPAAIGLALANAARLAPPWVPGAKERLVQETVVMTAFAGAALAYAVAFTGLGPDALDAGRLQTLSAKLPSALAAGIAGGMLGVLAGIALVKPYLTLTEMRAWMRQSPLFAPGPEPGARTPVFARLCLRFVDLLYDPAPDPAPEEPRER